MKHLIPFILGVILCFTIVSYFFFKPINLDDFRIDQIKFESTSGNFVFVAIPQKGRGNETMLNQFKEYQRKDSSRVNEKLYRVTRKNYLNVRRWIEYRVLPEWQYPLK